MKAPTQTTLPLCAQLLPPVRARGDNTPCDEVGARDAASGSADLLTTCQRQGQRLCTSGGRRRPEQGTWTVAERPLRPVRTVPRHPAWTLRR